MIYHGHFTHPDLWLMWFAIVGTLGNSFVAVYLLYKEFKRGQQKGIR